MPPQAPPVPAPAPIRLLGEQSAHCGRLRDVFARSPVALDLSALGCGKTYTGSALALDPALGFRHVVLLAPLSVLGKWGHIKATHGVPLTHALSYCQLRGVTGGKQPRHGLLRRTEAAPAARDPFADADEPQLRTVFAATPAFDALVREGVLLIVDEMQNVKNVNTQSAACQELVRAVVADFEARGPAEARSRVLLMSGTPFDCREQVVRLLRCLQICRQGALCAYNLQTYAVEWRGMHDVVAYCNALDPDATRRALGRYGPDVGARSATLKQLCYQLFQGVIKPALASEMAPPELRARLHKANAFYEIDGDSREALMASVHALEEAARLDTTVTTQAEKLTRITNAMMRIEAAKLGAMARVAAEKLEGFEDVKVVLCVNYTSSIDTLKQALARFGPLVLHGTMTARARHRVVQRFQAPDARHRLLIANLRTCSTGIDLDDKDGEFPRYCIASPTYSVIDIHQLGHRFLRLDTRSDAVLHLLYGRHASELHVLNALAAKTNVLKDTAQAQVRGGVLFPGDYPRYDVAHNVALLRDKRFGDIDWTDPSHAIVREFLPYLRARRTIGRALRRAFLDTTYAWCRRRLQREFVDINGGV